MSKGNGRQTDNIPRNDAYEKLLIGCTLHEPHAIRPYRNVIQPEDLFTDQARIALRAVYQLIDASPHPFPTQEIVNQIHRNGGLTRCPEEWLQEAADAALTSSMLDSYIAPLVQLATRRRAFFAAERIAQAAISGDDYYGALDSAVQIMRAARPAEPEKPKADAFHFWNVREFLNLNLFREYLIPGILAAGPTPCVVSGSFKTLKTSIGMDLLVSLATGSRFLGHYNVPQAVRVGVMSGESGAHNLQSILRRVIQSKGLLSDSLDPEMFHISANVPRLANPDHMAELEAFILKHDLKVMLIDPMYMALMGLGSEQSASVFQMGEKLAVLGAICQRTKAVIIAVHHNSRGRTRANPFEPAELDDISHAGFAEWAAQWLLLARRSRYDPDSDGEHELWLTAGGRDGHSTLVGVDVIEGRKGEDGEPDGRRWDVQVNDAATCRAEKAQQEKAQRLASKERATEQTRQADTEQVRQAISRMDEAGETKTTIRNRTKLSGERFNRAFEDCITEGRVMPTRFKNAYGRSMDGYKRVDPDHVGQVGQTMWDNVVPDDD